MFLSIRLHCRQGLLFALFSKLSLVSNLGKRFCLYNIPAQICPLNKFDTFFSHQGQFLLLRFFPLYFYFLFHTTFSTNLAYEDSRQPSSCSPLFSVYSRILLSPSQDPNSLHAKLSLLSSEWIQQPYGKVNPLLGWFPSSILGGCLLFSKDYILLQEHF